MQVLCKRKMSLRKVLIIQAFEADQFKALAYSNVPRHSEACNGIEANSSWLGHYPNSKAKCTSKGKSLYQETYSRTLSSFFNGKMHLGHEVSLQASCSFTAFVTVAAYASSVTVSAFTTFTAFDAVAVFASRHYTAPCSHGRRRHQPHRR